MDQGNERDKYSSNFKGNDRSIDVVTPGRMGVHPDHHEHIDNPLSAPWSPSMVAAAPQGVGRSLVHSHNLN